MSKKPIRFDWLTNIPAPYRNHAFERMHALLPAYGIDFRVLFMAWQEPRRPWNFRKEELRYPWRLHRGWHPVLRQIPLHFNPGLLAELRRDPPDVLMVGGWASPTQVLAPLFAPKSVIKVLGCESHAGSTTQSAWLGLRWLKGALIRRYDGFLVPQARSLAMLVELEASAAERPGLVFPNIVDESVFRFAVRAAQTKRPALRARFEVAAEQQLWLCPARLSQEKGLMPLLQAVESVPNVHLLIAGEGPQRSALQAHVTKHCLPVTLLGQQSEAQMVELYAAADWFVLPSLRDPSPLSAVEACASGLPLLASRHIGNFSDVLEEAVNGFGFDPSDADELASVLRRASALSAEDRRAMGERSLSRYQQHFASDACVRRLAEGLLALAAGRQPAIRQPV